MDTPLPNDTGLPMAASMTPTRTPAAAGVILVTLLFAVAVGLVLQGGAYAPSTWLPLMAAVAALALVVSIAGPAVISGRVQRSLLLVFFLQAAWTAASVFWADSRADAWEETNRTLLYALVLTLAFVSVRWAGATALKAIALAVTGVAGVVAVLALVTLSISSDPHSFFMSGRLNYPVTYFNGLSALLMVGFWLALGMGNGPRCAARTTVTEPEVQDNLSGAEIPESRVARRRARRERSEARGFPRWTQPLLLALAVVLLEVALLPQSRGALWTFFLVAPFFALLSAHRFRALANLGIVVLPVVLFWSKLNAPYLAITSDTSLDAAITTQVTALGYSVAVVVGGWAITWLVERWIGALRRKVAVWLSVALASLAILGAAGGIVYADIRTGGLDDYLSDRWQEMTADAVGQAEGATRFTGVGLNGRIRTWEVAVDAFQDNLALGLGAQNFEAYWYQSRPEAFTVRQPHSQPIQLLSELGIPGVALWILFVAAALIRAAAVRFRSSSWATRVTVGAMITATISWFIHSSADWLWQLAGVSLPAVMLLGALVGSDSGSRRSVSSEQATTDVEPAPAAVTEADPPDSGASADTSSKQTAERRRRGGRSVPVRLVAAVLALVALGSCCLPYLSIRYSALAAGSSDLDAVTSRSHTAAALDPTSLEPFQVRANAHVAAASVATDASQRLQQLRLAATAWEEALQVDPGSWSSQLQAAQVLFAARDAARAVDWTSVQELDQQARIHLEEARRLNPLSPEIVELEDSFLAF